MSDEYGVDLDEVFQVIDGAEVLIVRFQVVVNRLLIDFRTDSANGPYVALVAPAQSVEERVRSLRRVRPSFSYPEKLMSFHWRRSVAVLQESGVWDRIMARLVALGGDEAAQRAAATWDSLLREEQQQIRGAIRGGEQWQTLWERKRA